MVGFGFFAPFPLALMLPFMAAQSMMMGDAFGKSFQYGKRKISAKTNDEFNAMTPDDLADEIKTDYAAIIPVVTAAMQDSREFQRVVIQEIGHIITDLSDEIFRFLGLDPHFFHAGEVEPAPTPPPPGETPTELLSLTLSQISAASDLVLEAWIRAITDYDEQTRTWLIQENERRGNEAPPEEITPPQETSLLTPEFIESLDKADLKASGRSRVRIFQGVEMKWIVVRWCTFFGNTLTVRKFSGASWVDTAEGSGGVNFTGAVAIINKLKTELGTAFVQTFDDVDFFLINDDF